MEINKLKLFCITFHILHKYNYVLLQLLFCEYCKEQLSEKQYLLFLILNTIYEENEPLILCSLYEFIEEYIIIHKDNITKQLLYVQ